MRVMILGLLAVMGLWLEARAEVMVLLDQTDKLEDVVAKNCPWITSFEKVAVMEKTALGVGGDVGGWLSKELSDNDFLKKFEIPLPVGVQAVVLDPYYWNNDGQAEIVIGSLALTSRNGAVKIPVLSAEQKTLSQRRAVTGETLLICFEKQDDIVALALKVGTRNVDGSRPDLGALGLQESSGVKNTQP